MAEKIAFSIESARGSQALSVTYERAGKGEPLLLLHGIGHHWQAWEPVMGILAAERDVIAVDLPGFGTSPALPDGVSYDLTTVGSVLGALCESLAIERPHVAGNSWEGCSPWSWAGKSSSGRSRLCRPSASGRRASASTPSGCCSPCDARPRCCRCR